MAEDIISLYQELLHIKTYLSKLGPDRRTPSVQVRKLEEAETLYGKFDCLVLKLNEQTKVKALDSKSLNYLQKLCVDIPLLYSKIKSYCERGTTSTETKMESFNLKTALSLLPVMTGDENITKQLISSIELYESMLESSGKTALINFVLKTRLSEGAKLRMSENYSTVSGLLQDMRDRLLTKKSDTALQQKLQSVRQDRKTVAEFGKEVEQLFVDLTISQANGDQTKYNVLKPINEKNAIKRFADGLRSSRLSTIITARNYVTLREAISGALDEETAADPEGTMMNFRGGRGRSDYYNTRNYNNFRQQGRYQYRGSYPSYSEQRTEQRTDFYRGNSRGLQNNFRGRGTQDNFGGRGRSRSFYNSNNRGNRPQINLAQGEGEVQGESFSNANADTENSRENEINLPIQFFRS